MAWSCKDGAFSHSANIFLSTYCVPGPVLKRRCFSDNICTRSDQERGECFALVGSSGCSDSRRVFLLEPHLTGGIITLCPTSDVSWAEAQRSLVPRGQEHKLRSTVGRVGLPSRLLCARARCDGPQVASE